MLKYCPWCEEMNPSEDFGKNQSTADGLSAYCNSCRAAKQSDDYYGHRRKVIRNSIKKYYLLNTAKISTYKKNWYFVNRKRLNKKSAKLRFSQLPKWRKYDSDRSKDPKRRLYRTQLLIQRRRLKSSFNRIPFDLWESLRKEYKGLCAYCQKAPSNTIDHVVPLTLGGNHDFNNVLPACSRCNGSKGQKSLAVWLDIRNVC